MRRAARELVIFGVGPVLLILVCIYGAIGGFARGEAFVPLYAIGLIFGTVCIGTYGVALLFRAINGLLTRSRTGRRGTARARPNG